MQSGTKPRTVGQALDAFLDAERLRLKVSTLARYRNVVTLFRIFLENSEIHAAPGLSADVEMTPVLATEFVNSFLGGTLNRGENSYRAATTVMRRLLNWLDDRMMEEHDPAETVDRTATEVTAAVNVHKILSQHLVDQVPTHAVRHRRDQFTVTRVEVGALWLQSLSVGGDAIGPVSVPMPVSQLCQEGWDIDCVVAKTFGGWRLMEVWSVSA